MGSKWCPLFFLWQFSKFFQLLSGPAQESVLLLRARHVFKSLDAAHCMTDFVINFINNFNALLMKNALTILNSITYDIINCFLYFERKIFFYTLYTLFTGVTKMLTLTVSKCFQVSKI